MDFHERMQRAVERGAQSRDALEQQRAADEWSEEQCRRQHAQFRRDLSDYMERCLHELADNFPGFRTEQLLDEKGWGVGVTRDDLFLDKGKRQNVFSRLQLTVSPLNTYRVLEIAAKGTVRNREAFQRNHYQKLAEVDLPRFQGLIEQWVLDYAEMYAAAP